MRVFILQHVHEFPDGHECVKRIGVYSTEARALEAQRKVQDAPGFRDAPGGFDISDLEVDPPAPEWPEGYLTYGTILVPALIDGIEGLRPLQAWDMGAGVYEIGDNHDLPKNEILRFPEGSKVRCRPHKLVDGTFCPLAYESAT